MQVACPTCLSRVEWNTDSLYRPFCSERCKQIDLGAWANEQYTIAASEPEPEPEEKQASSV